MKKLKFYGVKAPNKILKVEDVILKEGSTLININANITSPSPGSLYYQDSLLDSNIYPILEEPSAILVGDVEVSDKIVNPKELPIIDSRLVEGTINENNVPLIITSGHEGILQNNQGGTQVSSVTDFLKKYNIPNYDPNVNEVFNKMGTFIVKSNDDLGKWLTNESGYDYTHIWISPGYYTYTIEENCIINTETIGGDGVITIEGGDTQRSITVNPYIKFRWMSRLPGLHLQNIELVNFHGLSKLTIDIHLNCKLTNCNRMNSVRFNLFDASSLEINDSYMLNQIVSYTASTDQSNLTVTNCDQISGFNVYSSTKATFSDCQQVTQAHNVEFTGTNYQLYMNSRCTYSDTSYATGANANPWVKATSPYRGGFNE